MAQPDRVESAIRGEHLLTTSSASRATGGDKHRFELRLKPAMILTIVLAIVVVVLVIILASRGGGPGSRVKDFAATTSLTTHVVQIGYDLSGDHAPPDKMLFSVRFLTCVKRPGEAKKWEQTGVLKWEADQLSPTFLNGHYSLTDQAVFMRIPSGTITGSRADYEVTAVTKSGKVLGKTEGTANPQHC